MYSERGEIELTIGDTREWWRRADNDSSGDYWRVLKDKDGNVTKVLDDGDREHATIVEADGTERKVKLQSGGVSGAIAAAVGNGMTQEQMNKIMVNSGLDWTQEKGWYAKDESAKYTAPVAPIVEQSAIDKVTTWATSKIEQTGKWLSSVGTEFSKFAGRNLETEAVERAGERNDTSMNIADMVSRTQVLIDKGVDYGKDGQRYTNWIVNSDSTEMNCVGLVSFLYGVQPSHSTELFHLHPDFNTVGTLVPGDVINILASNGTETNNHMVAWLGSSGPNKGVSDQIIESAYGVGVRISTLSRLTQYYRNAGFDYIPTYYRYKTK